MIATRKDLSGSADGASRMKPDLSSGKAAPEAVQGEACPVCESKNVMHLMHCKNCESDYAGAEQINRNAAISRANTAAAKPDAELVELLKEAREFAAAYVNNSFFGPNARKTLARIDAKLKEYE